MSDTCDKTLDELLAAVGKARSEGRLPLTPTREERINWVLGNLNASTRHKTTREAVERAVDELDEERRRAAKDGAA